MTGRNGRGRWDRVVAARRQARAALGRDPNVSDSPPKARTPLTEPSGPVWAAHGPGVGALSLGEAAVRLGVSRAELEAMIAAGKIEALPTGFARMIPTSEVVRLNHDSSGGIGG
jgi:excisionase family DNA binding protein